MRESKKFPVYWTGLGIYTIILLIFGACFLAYTDKALQQYENSQPETVMENYVAEFQQMAADGTLYDKMEMSSSVNEFESVDVYKELYKAHLAGITEYTFVKSESSYLAEKPEYYICGDGKPVAKIVLSASNEHTIFGILTIMDWQTESLDSAWEGSTKDYIIRIPDDYTATVNGVELSEANLTGEVIENPEFENVSNYVKMPAFVEYSAQGLMKEPKIRVFGADGQEREVVADEDGAFVLTQYQPSDNIPKERYDDALKMAQTWENFLTRDLPGEAHGLATIRKYLIKDSYYWNLAKQYANSVDITFISGHRMDNPPYSNIKISDYVSYGENCYSCYIYFEKNMILTKTGESRVDKIDSTFYFVKYDDSDDKKDNPHWAIADMIAKTESKGN